MGLPDSDKKITPSVVRNPTPTKYLRLLATLTPPPQPWLQVHIFSRTLWDQIWLKSA